MTVETRPLLDFGAGYVQRALDGMPRQGPREPWVMSMDYFRDIKLCAEEGRRRMLRFSTVPDAYLHKAWRFRLRAAGDDCGSLLRATGQASLCYHSHGRNRACGHPHRRPGAAIDLLA